MLLSYQTSSTPALPLSPFPSPSIHSTPLRPASLLCSFCVMFLFDQTVFPLSLSLPPSPFLRLFLCFFVWTHVPSHYPALYGAAALVTRPNTEETRAERQKNSVAKKVLFSSSSSSLCCDVMKPLFPPFFVCFLYFHSSSHVTIIRKNKEHS